MQLKKSKMKVTILVALIISLLTACSSKPDTKEFPKSANANQEILNLESAIQNSTGQNYHILAPVAFDESKESLKEAKTFQNKDKSDEKILKEVALGQAYLSEAAKVSSSNQGKVSDIMAARQRAVDANAATLLPSQLAKLDEKVIEETTKLEKGKKDDLKEKKSKLIVDYQNLELNSIKKAYLGESETLINAAVQNGAQHLAPKTLEEANRKYQEADAFISQNRHNQPDNEIMAAAALVAAKNLESTTATARGLTAATPEETAISMTATQEALAKEKGTAKDLESKNSQMNQEHQLNAIYEEARTKFSEDEAEVYKQGPALVIRLRSLEFPKDEAVLKGDDFALLKKVDEVIEDFNKSKVVVEGHTDSTGGPQLNQRLSQERADAVKEYLEVNTEGNVAEFEAKGFSYEKPLASNKSTAGRAQNRRVDVIIEPVTL